MKKRPVVGGLLLLAALSTSGAMSSMDWAKSKLDSLMDSAEQVASSVKETASSMFVNTDNGYCTDESCSEPPSVADVVQSSGSYMQSWDIFSTIQEYLTKIQDTVVYNINKKAKEVYEKLEDFADRVRTVFREEFGSFLEVLWERALGTAPESGKYRHLSNCRFIR